MRPFTFVLLILCIALAGYWTGNTNMLLVLYNQQGNTTLSVTNTTTNTTSPTAITDPSNFNGANAVWDQIWKWMLILALVSVAGGIIGGFLQNQGIGQGIGFSAFYMLPMIMVYAIFNFVFMPTSYILDNTTPQYIAIPFIVIMNVLLTMAIYTAGRGNS